MTFFSPFPVVDPNPTRPPCQRQPTHAPAASGTHSSTSHPLPLHASTHEHPGQPGQPLRAQVLGVGVATSSPSFSLSLTIPRDLLPTHNVHNVRNARRSIDSSRSKQFDDTASIAESVIAPLPEPRLPDLDLPQSELDLTMTFESIMSDSVSSSTVAAEPE